MKATVVFWLLVSDPYLSQGQTVILGQFPSMNECLEEGHHWVLRYMAWLDRSHLSAQVLMGNGPPRDPDRSHRFAVVYRPIVDPEHEASRELARCSILDSHLMIATR